MRKVPGITLSPVLRKWVESQAKAGGFASADEFVHHLIRVEHSRAHSSVAGDTREQIEAQLLAAAEGPAYSVPEAMRLARAVRATKRAGRQRKAS